MTSFVSPNFGFLSSHDPLLLSTAARAERYVFEDPNVSMFKSRQFAELLVKQVAARSPVRLIGGESLYDLVSALSSQGILGETVAQLVHHVRTGGNRAVHSHSDDQRLALELLGTIWKPAIWYHYTYGKDPKFNPKHLSFAPPPPPQRADDALREEIETLRQRQAEQTEQLRAAVKSAASESKRRAEEARLRQEAEEEARTAYAAQEQALRLVQETEEQLAAEQARFEAELAAISVAAMAESVEVQQALVRRGQQASEALPLDEADTRKMVDAQLREAGWDADTVALTFGKGVRPQKGRNVAIAEWPTETGPADYVLFAGLTPIAVVEAKRQSVDVPGSLEQSRRYSEGFEITSDMASPGGPWGAYTVPFLYATNGRPFLRQLQDRSGIWFRDARRSTNLPRALRRWHSPEGLVDMLAQDTEAADAQLASESSDYLPLRHFQHEAVRAAEEALAAGKREALLAMATGTGKTRTSIGLIYRLVKSGRFRRVLFLVDRTALGEQAAGAFKDARLESMRSFGEIYEIKELGDLAPERDTRLHFATIQGMIRRLLISDEETLPVDAYDCIVVDECHRGYNLDREMTDAELEFRDQSDYVSKYRQVLDHFDAVKIGLTATPALHTTQIFGDPIYVYDYRQAVIDGYLVDHEPPVRIETKLGTEGITWERDADVPVIDPVTGQLELFHTEDELHFEIEQFNKLVVTENFNRVVCDALADKIDLIDFGKTLVFCATDNHADMVVRLLKEAYERKDGEVENDAIVKITGAADKPLELIRRYKNERLPQVAVTVDLLTTGIDVPEIFNLVFLRPVRSRILYEQMMGRATRLCPELRKEVFKIYDAVDLYSALEPYTSMHPVVAKPQITFEQLADELSRVEDPDSQREFADQFVAKLQLKRSLLEGQLLEDFQALADGKTPDEFASEMRGWEPEDRRLWFTDHMELAGFLDRVKRSGGRKQLVSEHDDELIRVTRGYGAAEKPQVYLADFQAFITSEENQNKLPALKIVMQRPRDLTREALQGLRLALDREGFTDSGLRVALKESKNVDIAASIVGYIRHMALGSPLVPYEERVASAVARILGGRDWTESQRRWLEHIGKQLREEIVVDRAALDRGQFKRAGGGFSRLNKVFDGQLQVIQQDMQDEVWREAG